LTDTSNDREGIPVISIGGIDPRSEYPMLYPMTPPLLTTEVGGPDGTRAPIV
jgi:hypothetical protein